MAVPDSSTFSFLNVCNELYRGYDYGFNLSQAFTDSDAAKFDSRYGSKNMNPKTLYGFRNYGVQGGIVISTPSFVIIKYLWEYADGGNIDVMAEFVASGIPGLNGKPVGFQYILNDTNGVQVNAGGLNILRYGGYNIGSSSESILIDLSVLTNATNFPNLIETSLVDLYANWFNYRRNGNCTIEIKAYRGGTISNVQGEFINNGGTSILIPALTITKNVPAEGTTNYQTFRTSYTYMGQVTYSKSTGNISLSI